MDAQMTGRLSVRAGIGFVGSGSNGVFTAEAVGCLPSNETTIADVMKKAGYKTGAVGKVSVNTTCYCSRSRPVWSLTGGLYHSGIWASSRRAYQASVGLITTLEYLSVVTWGSVPGNTPTTQGHRSRRDHCHS